MKKKTSNKKKTKKAAPVSKLKRGPRANYPAVQNVLYRSLSMAFNEIQKNIQPEKLSGLALFLLSGGFAGLEATPRFPCARFGISLHTKQDQESQESPPTDLAFTRWIPARWDMRDVYPKSFRNINNVLEASLSVDHLHSFRHLCEIAVRALEQARQDFPAFKECIFVFVTNDAYSFDPEVQWVRRLNSVADAQEFEDMLNQHIGNDKP